MCKKCHRLRMKGGMAVVVARRWMNTSEPHHKRYCQSVLRLLAETDGQSLASSGKLLIVIPMPSKRKE